MLPVRNNSFNTESHNRECTHFGIGHSAYHDNVIKWKHFPRNWPFVRGIHRSPVNSTHKVQWRRALMFSLIPFSLIPFSLIPNKRLSKQWWGWWFETLSSPLWRHCNVLDGNFSNRFLALNINCLMFLYSSPQLKIGTIMMLNYSCNTPGLQPSVKLKVCLCI